MIKIKIHNKKFKCLFLILCYVLGSVISPIVVGNSENSSSTQQNVEGSNRLMQLIQMQNTGASSVSDFLDVTPNDWYYPYLEGLVKDGIINGKSKTEFVPNGTFSFAECSAVITRYLGLEEYASEKALQLRTAAIQGSSLWYSGYFQVMHELGIFDESFELYSLADGFVVIDEEKANFPMKRHEFATAISKSFQLNGAIRSQNLYSEVSGLGHDFIMGGRYSERYLLNYENYIADYNNIPEENREYILKAYYNGIINGDPAGNFNPMDNIKRCEMAKVIAAVRDYSLRKCLVTNYCPKPSEDKFFNDGNGNISLNYKYSLQTLQKCAAGFDASGNNIVYTAMDELPYGYCVDVYMYTVEDDICKPVMQYSLADSDVDSSGFTYQRKDGENCRAILVLRDLTDNAKPEFTLNVAITPDGILTKTFITSL